MPMLKRFAPLVPLALVTLLFGCAAQGPASHSEQQPQDHNPIAAQSAFKAKASSSSVFGEPEELATEDDTEAFSSSKPYQLPALADSVLERGMSLIGTRYRFGGTSEQSGFDCSGFIGYLFREEAGVTLPRSTREMINVDAPKVARNKLKPGDLLFFSTNGRAASAMPASTLVTTSSSTPAAAAAVACASTASVTVTGARPSSKPSAPWPWRRPPISRATDSKMIYPARRRCFEKARRRAHL